MWSCPWTRGGARRPAPASAAPTHVYLSTSATSTACAVGPASHRAYLLFCRHVGDIVRPGAKGGGGRPGDRAGPLAALAARPGSRGTPTPRRHHAGTPPEIEATRHAEGGFFPSLDFSSEVFCFGCRLARPGGKARALFGNGFQTAPGGRPVLERVAWRCVARGRGEGEQGAEAVS